MSNSTTYVVSAINAEGGETVIATKSKKAQAISAADEARKTSRNGVVVRTSKGTEVYLLKGVRPMKRTVAYTRTVDLPEGVVVPAGLRVAYLRKRHNAAILHDANAEREAQYRIMTLDGTLLEDEFATTRAAGKHVLTLG